MIRNKLIYHLPVVVLIFIIIIYPLLRPGLIVGGDWTFPATNKQLQVFANEALSLWSFREIPTGSQIPHQNLYLFQILAGLWASIGFDGISFQKITLIITIFGIYIFSNRLFFRLTNNIFSSIIGSISYVFTPILFNYLNMGWNYVLLFMALAPIFCMASIDYIKYGKLDKLLLLGFLSAIGLFQSQSIVWFLIIILIINISYIRVNNLIASFTKSLISILSIVTITTLTHLPWILPTVIKQENSFSSTSSYDLVRFSSVTSIINSFRGWGSLFNQQFELSHPAPLLIFSFFPIILIIYQLVFGKNNENYLRIFKIVLALILVSPALYIFRNEIARLPFSTIVRDSGRFLVLTSLGFSLGISLILSQIKNIKTIFFVVLCIFLSAYPFYSGKLYSMKDNPISSENTYKDFRLNLLNTREIDIENKFTRYNDQRNIFMPTGGFLFTTSDNRFNRSYWGIADIQTRFSPYGSGIYFSDKSNPLVTNFTQNFFHSAESRASLIEFSRVYGIQNIFYRQGLTSTLVNNTDFDSKNNNCKNYPNIDSDWSVTSICSVDDSYPMFFSSVTPTFSEASISGQIKIKHDKTKYLTVIGCLEQLNLGTNPCSIDLPTMSKETPTITFKKIGVSKYLVHASGIAGNYLLIFNQTYHDGWRVLSESGNTLSSRHILINHLVNGWILSPNGDEKSAQYIIDFYPQSIYAKILPWSLGLFIIICLYLLSHYLSKRKNEQV